MMKKTIIFLSCELILLFALSFWWVSAQTDYFSKGKVPILHIYGDKIVYTSDRNLDVYLLEADCRRRGGKFNRCGSVCPSDAEVCPSICAYTCELIKK